MPDTTVNLEMPIILPSQAQKHVTHNEALLVLDAVVQLCLEALEQNAPPTAFADGQIWSIGQTPTGEWTHYPGLLAMRASSGWLFVRPREGWRAWDRSNNALLIYHNNAWTPLPLFNLPGVGIGTMFDAVNRLAVASQATLLTHDGAGHQLKINKAAVADTASLLFQSNWSGRAEMGLAGSDAFAIKVSSDGTAWAEALAANPVTGRVTLPAGATLAAGSAAAPSLSFGTETNTGLNQPAAGQIGVSVGGTQRAVVSAAGLAVTGLMSGTAVTQSVSDTTAGRLTKVGDFGIGVLGQVNYLQDIDSLTIPSGLWQTDGVAGGQTFGTFPVGAPTRYGYLLSNRVGSQNQQQLWQPLTTERLWVRRLSGGVWQPWRELFTQASILGSVSQAAGIPTGAIIERGGNANGEFIRYADGTQECWRTLTAATGAGVVWTFPAAFSVAPVVNGNSVATVQSVVMLDAAPSTTAVTLSSRGTNDARRADVMHLHVKGRWF